MVKGNKNKRSLATREKEVVDEAEEFPKTSGIDVPADSENSDIDDGDEDIEEGDFDEILKEMAADQGLSSADEDLENEADDDDQDQGESEAGDESDIHSSDIEGASSEDGEEEDDDDEELGSDISDDEDDNTDELPVKRTSSRLTDGQDT
ncbi:hypothetical protein GGI23_007522, partial [Coemansia sp. RSA 2559]